MKNTTPVRKSTLSLMAVMAAVAMLAGCETTKLNEPTSAVPVETRSPVPVSQAGGPGATTGTAPQSRVATVDLASKPGGAGTGVAGAAASMSMPSPRVVYFDFDSFAIKDDYKSVVDGFGRVLQLQPAKHMVVEGYTDERGGREYNLALGQKRAEAVVKSLKLLGAADSQLEAVSFGEERPAAAGNDEAAWAKNRRAELKDR